MTLLFDLSYEILNSFAGKNKRTQPHWEPPQGTAQPKLCLYNSLTRNKVNVFSFCHLWITYSSHHFRCSSFLCLEIIVETAMPQDCCGINSVTLIQSCYFQAE